MYFLGLEMCISWVAVCISLGCGYVYLPVRGVYSLGWGDVCISWGGRCVFAGVGGVYVFWVLLVDIPM